MDYVLDEILHGPTRVCVLVSLLDRVCVAHNSREYRWRRQQTTGGRGKHIYRSTSDRAIVRMFCPNAPSSSTEHPMNPAPSGLQSFCASRPFLRVPVLPSNKPRKHY
jgi:hypothetical protein